MKYLKFLFPLSIILLIAYENEGTLQSGAQMDFIVLLFFGGILYYIIKAFRRSRDK